MLHKINFYLIVTFISVFAYSCSMVNNVNMFSDADDVQLGKEVVQEINGNSAEYPIYKGNPAVKQYINDRIFKHILNSSKITKKGVFNYTIEIVKRDDIMNAFALPGGHIYIYTGLLKYLDSEAALAGVIAHEIAHAEKRHSTQRMTKHYGASILIGLVLGNNPSQLAEIVSNLFVGVAFLANSRADEDEADAYSFEYLRESRYYPGAVKFFFEKMQADNLIQGKSSKIEIFLSTHPDPIDRINTINSKLNSLNIPVLSYKDNGNNIFRAEYKKNIVDKI
ncbi:MAG: M48 family metalloprotease [bacterium]